MMKIPRFQKRDRRMRQVSKSGRPKPTTLEHTLEPIMSLSPSHVFPVTDTEDLNTRKPPISVSGWILHL
jgi:hypothetical protein